SPPPLFPPLPYTTLFRSRPSGAATRSLGRASAVPAASSLRLLSTARVTTTPSSSGTGASTSALSSGASAGTSGDAGARASERAGSASDAPGSATVVPPGDTSSASAVLGT